MIYKKTLTPTEYFTLPASEIEASAGFWMRLKDKTGSLESEVISVPWTVAEIKGFKESSKAAQIFPENFLFLYLETQKQFGQEMFKEDW